MDRLLQFGEHIKKLRQAKSLTLRKFCATFGFDPGNISKLERGKLQIPGSPTLKKIAYALDLDKDEDGWDDFFVLAALCVGKIPESIMSDDELVKKLPVAFKAVKECSINELAEVIRRS